MLTGKRKAENGRCKGRAPSGFLLALCCAALALGAAAQSRAWWQHAVIYEVYPRSFADSNGDGVGDLRGITAHLDYLQQLGVDAIWITPFYPSPQVDGGYDISDYTAIDPQYGTLADFDSLMVAARRRGIRVVLDLVMNHTSDQHPWFIDSRSSRTSRHRDYYIWRDGRNGGPPNNWLSLFGGPAWQFDARTRQYYYHYYYPQQPDLNWRNPAVERDMFDAVRLWFQRGVAGFRLDSVGTLFEDAELHDNPPGWIRTGDFAEPQQRHVHNYNLPEVHSVLRDLRRVADASNAVLIGETVGDNETQLARYYGLHNDEIELPFNFLFMDVNRLSAPEFRRHIAAWDANPAGGTPEWFFDNHDQPRELDRYGDGRHNPQIARLLPTLLLTLRGTAVLYYGQEIGMTTTDPVSIAEVKDPMGRRYWPRYKGRDGERTPMQWDGSAHAGFTTGTPWLRIPDSARQVNVAAESRDPGSLLEYYRKLIQLRRGLPALRDGDWESVNSRDPNVLSYLRSASADRVLVALNMSAASQHQRYSFGATQLTVLLDSAARTSASLSPDDVVLAPFEALVAGLSR